jgi:FkbH-like protein
MHYLTSNFNLIESNSLWNKLKKNHTVIDKNYNGLTLSLNKKNLDNYNFFHSIIYIDRPNFNQTIKELKNLIQIVKRNKKKNFFLYFLNNFYNNPIEHKIFNDRLLKIKFDIENLFIKNFDHNNTKLFSERNRIYIKFPFELRFIKFISNEIKKNINFFSVKPYKLIILDCDNTLWGGVLDEDGYENIKYAGDGDGQIFQQFQFFLKKKKKEGFLLTISSKNDEIKVWNAMEKRGMILQKKDFVNSRINWEDKAKNINQIINQLTLRADDCVFIDDNPLEIEKVKSQIKGIDIINSSKSLSVLSNVNSNPRLFKYKILKEDLTKYKQYKLKSKFEDISGKSDHSIQFYKKLKQKIIFESINDKNLDRALQLFNKTNQFNFNLNRYTNQSFKKLLKNKAYSIETIGFMDKFGDHGIVGVYIAKKKRLKVEVIDFVLSCRVLNRYIEDFTILRILKANKNKNISIYYKKDKLNSVLIPMFLNKNYFKLNKKNKNLFKYDIKLKNDFHEIKKIFSR